MLKVCFADKMSLQDKNGSPPTPHLVLDACAQCEGDVVVILVELGGQTHGADGGPGAQPPVLLQQGLVQSHQGQVMLAVSAACQGIWNSWQSCTRA